MSVFVMVMMVMLMVMIIAKDDIELHGTQIGQNDTRCPQCIPFDRQLVQLGFHISQVQTKIKERTNCHIPADTGEAVEVQSLHVSGWYHVGTDSEFAGGNLAS